MILYNIFDTYILAFRTFYFCFEFFIRKKKKYHRGDIVATFWLHREKKKLTFRLILGNTWVTK